MDYIGRLESYWSDDEGVLYKLRQGVFQEKGFTELVSFLKDMKLNDDEVINKRLVSLLWYIPLFIPWHYERVSKDDREKLSAFADTITNLLEEILGVP